MYQFIEKGMRVSDIAQRYNIANNGYIKLNTLSILMQTILVVNSRCHQKVDLNTTQKDNPGAFIL